MEQIEAKADDALTGGLTKLNAEEKAVLAFLKRRMQQNKAATKRKGGLIDQLKASIDQPRKKGLANDASRPATHERSGAERPAR